MEQNMTTMMMMLLLISCSSVALYLSRFFFLSFFLLFFLVFNFFTRDNFFVRWLLLECCHHLYSCHHHHHFALPLHLHHHHPHSLSWHGRQGVAGNWLKNTTWESVIMYLNFWAVSIMYQMTFYYYSWLQILSFSWIFDSLTNYLMSLDFVLFQVHNEIYMIIIYWNIKTDWLWFLSRRRKQAIQ